MEYLILAVIGWVIVFALIPFERIKQIALVPVISFIWLLIVDTVSVSLGYYTYKHILIPIGNVPFFHLLAGAAAGTLIVNWLNASPWSKILAVLIAGTGIVILENIYAQFGAFAYIRADVALGIIHSIAAFSILIWLCLGIVGKENIYYGKKSRLNLKSPA